MASRPRAPGRHRTIGERLRGNRQQLVLGGLVAGAALLVAATLGALALNARETTTSPGADNASAPHDGGTQDTSSTVIDGPTTPIELPLEAGDVGFEATVTDVAPAEGPEAASFCDNTAATDGLNGWDGNVFTEVGGRRRVVQILSRFRSSVDAAAFVSSNATIVDCETWQTEGSSGPITFAVAETTPTMNYGDETRQFDLTASMDGPDLFLRVLLTRSGRDVFQITYVSANRQDLDNADRVIATANEKSGF